MGSDDYSDADSKVSSSRSRSRSKSSEESRKKKDKKVSKKDKKAGKGKKDKKKVKKDKKKKKKEKKKDKKRKRSRSYSSSYSYSYSYSDDRRGGRNGRREGRSRSRSRRPRADYAAMQMMPHMGMPPMAMNLPPLNLPADGSLTMEQACEAAGRGVASGNTVFDNQVTVYNSDGDPVSKPDKFDTFDEIKDFPRELREALRDAGFPSPSQIQAYTWPLGVRSKDIIGIAATGSGKTLAFLLPAFAHMLDEGHKPERDGPGLLVLSPTRELAQQIEAEAARFGRSLGMRCVAMYGGAPKPNQISKYRQGVHCIVACPGRLNDFLEAGQVRLENVMKLVLDEADRMLDMGFEPQITKILAKVPRKRHTMFFTATWPKEVRELASEILSRPYKVMIGNRDVLKGNQDITQLCRIVDSFHKNNAVINLLHEAGLTRRESCGKCLIFCNTKRMCEQLSQQLARSGLACASIHGDKDQRQRDDALNGLKSGYLKVLVATDVAARGLDIKGVGLVVNYDPANNTEDYVHRIGRTGRAGAKGFAVTFLTGADAVKAKGIVEVMQRTNQHIDPQVRALAESAAPSGGGRRGGRRGGGGGGGGGKLDHDRGPSPERHGGFGASDDRRSRSLSF